MQDRNNRINSRAGQGLIRLVHNAWNLAFADGAALVSIAVFIIIMGRLYGSATLGKFSFAVALSSMAQTIADAGFDISLPRSVSQSPESSSSNVADALRTKIFLCLCTLPLAFAASFMKDSQTIITTAVMLADVLPSTLAFAYLAALRGMNQSALAARINALYNVLPILCCIGLVWFSPPISVFALLIFIGDCIKLIHIERVYNRFGSYELHLRSILKEPALIFEKSLLRKSWNEQRGVTLTALYSAALVRMPSVMLGWFATDAHHGIYAAASRFFTALRIIPGALLNVIIPEYARSDARSPRIRVVFVAALICATVVSAIVALFAPTIIAWSFRYDESVVILQTLALAFGALFMKTTLEAFLLARKREQIVHRILGIVCLLSVIAYAWAAQRSALDVARIVCTAEMSLFLIFFAVFVRDSRRAAKQQIAESVA